MNHTKLVIRPIIQKNIKLISIFSKKKTRIFIKTTLFITRQIWRIKNKANFFFPKFICYPSTKEKQTNNKKAIVYKTSSKIRSRFNKIAIVKNRYLQKKISTSLVFKLIPTQYNENSINSDKFSQFKDIVGLIVNTNFSFYQINAVSMARYYFDCEIKKAQTANQKNIKSSKKFIQSLERELTSRFSGSGAYFKDLVRVSFFAIYIKKADFVAGFFASLISKLPRNRKEIPFVYFLVKILKIAASKNVDILGTRIRFQGRLNRWNRTKHIEAVKGSIGYVSYNNRIEYGKAQAITRKGALGIHVWICYKDGTSNKIGQDIISYRNWNILT